MNRLREMREDNDLLQKDIARELGITQRNYSYLETGKTLLTDDMLKKIANFYNVSIDYILYETDTRKRYPKSIVQEETMKEEVNC